MKKICFALIIVMLHSCASTNKINLENWNPASENVTELKVLVEDDGLENCPIVMKENSLIFQSLKNDNFDLWLTSLNKKTGLTQITTYDGPDMVPCAHPDGKKYVFLSDRGQTGFYMGEIGKATAVFLVEASAPQIGGWTRGDISPDGKTFLYVSGNFIWTFDFETKTKTQLVQGTEPRYSPDGSKIIFRKIRFKISKIYSTSIWVMNKDGSDMTQIISGDEEFTYFNALMSPDGSKIMYSKGKIIKKWSGTTLSGTDLWMCNIDGNDHVQITTNPYDDYDFTWVDNNRVVFVSNRPQTGQTKDFKSDIWELKIPNN